MEQSKRIAIAYFQQFGFEVEDIPTCDDQRADIRAFDSTRHEYVTEVKDRLDDPETVASQLETISDGKSVTTFRVSPMDHCNTLDGIFKDGGVQLAETPSGAKAFHLLWLHCNGIDARLQSDRARNTFYGVVPVTPSNDGDGHMCFYFDFNTSYMLPHVNGLVIFEMDGIKLHINEFAVNANEFRACELVSIMGDAVFDPKTIVANEEHIAFNGNISRKNEAEVLQALQEQTGIAYRTARMKRQMF